MSPLCFARNCAGISASEKISFAEDVSCRATRLERSLWFLQATKCRLLKNHAAQRARTSRTSVRILAATASLSVADRVKSLKSESGSGTLSQA